MLSYSFSLNDKDECYGNESFRLNFAQPCDINEWVAGACGFLVFLPHFQSKQSLKHKKMISNPTNNYFSTDTALLEHVHAKQMIKKRFFREILVMDI